MSEEFIIVQMSVDLLKKIINDAMADVVKASIEQVHQKKPKEDRVMGVTEICRSLGIGRTRFESYKEELIAAGMFKLSEQGSYRIFKQDFERWLNSKKQAG